MDICTSFITPISSEKSLWTDNGNFRLRIRCFWTPRTIFEKSLKTPLESHMNNVCTNFQLTNPYRFRKIALDRQCGFSAKNFGVFNPLGGQKGDFRKIIKNAFRGSYEQHLYHFSAL